jgi:two-component system nitrogen regulation sensor histidine kinase NtrY
MNSVTPIASLASTVSGLVGRSESSAEGAAALSEETRADIRAAAATIEKRSQGLLRFIEAYRNLTQVPRPGFQVFPVADILARVVQLMKDQLDRGRIACSVKVEPETLELTADRGLVEQVLINVVLNAIQALRESGQGNLELSSCLDQRGRVVITVADDGPGIGEDIRERIFTPFFTTRKDGSGIGLSLSRQIMRLHGGSITVQSEPGTRTVFSLRF